MIRRYSRNQELEYATLQQLYLWYKLINLPAYSYLKIGAALAPPPVAMNSSNYRASDFAVDTYSALGRTQSSA